jgi:hypothetical protein
MDRVEASDGWPIEDIPNADRVFYRVHVNLLPASHELVPGVFREQHGSMSVDWGKYSSAKDTRARGSEPDKNGVVALVAGEVRSIDGLVVHHAPDRARNNRAHAEILGIEIDTNGSGSTRMPSVPPKVRRLMIRERLLEICNGWEIRPS